MSLFKIKNPVEYSFIQWMNNFPDSGHWADKERFFRFVKTVSRYKALRWKNANYLKKRILDRKPNFDADFLENILDLYSTLLEFQGSKAVSSQFRLSDRKVKTNHFIEIRVKNGVLIEEELPFESNLVLGTLVD
ncbi:MAG TPA: hypothetical protein PK036_07850 [Geobacteraceae bacterium]|nr:hypothetical protein [Geobacteraceae bacterium]